MKVKGFFLVSIFLLLASQAFAGWVIEEVSGYPEGEKIRETIYFQKNKIKMVDSEQIMIFDLEKGMLYFLNPDREIYWGGTPEEFQKAMKEAMKLAMEQMLEEMLEEMAPEQREAYKQFMEEMEEETKEATPEKKVNVEVKKTSEKATVAGYSAQKYQVWVDGELKEELWISTEINLKDEIDLKKFVQFIEALSGPGEEEFYESSPEYMGLMKQGYPLRSIEYDQEEEQTVTEVAKVEKRQIPDSEFELPKSYRKVSIGEMWQEQKLMEGQEDDYQE